MSDSSNKLPPNYYFDNDLVEKLLIEYHKTGCTDITLRDKIMEHANELIINVIRAHNLHNIYVGKDDSSFNDLYQIAWCSIESALYKFNSGPGHPKIFNMWCCTPDALIFTDNGIEQLQEAVLRLDTLVYWLGKLYKIGAGLIRPTDKTIKITTAMGYNIECSCEHKLLAYKNDIVDLIPAKDLKINDLVAIQYNQQHFINDDNINNGLSKKIHKNLAYIIGLCIANGGLLNDRIIIYNAPYGADKLLFNHKIDAEYNSHNKSLHIYDDRLIQLMIKYGFKPNADCDHIPLKLLRMSKNNIIALLTGIFNDGRLFRITNKYKTNSKLIANQITMMLLNLGMLITISERNNNWTLQLLEPRIPYTTQCSCLLREFYKQSTIRNKSINYDLTPHNINVAYDRLLRVINCAANGSKNKHSIIWLPIAKMQKSQSKLCEISIISQDHLYVSNGFVSHNSQIARTAILAAIKKDNRDKKNFDGYRQHLDTRVEQNKTQFIRFLNEAKTIYKYVDEFLDIINAMEEIYLHDPKPYEGLINKVAKKLNISRIRVIKFIKILRAMSFEFTDSPVDNEYSKPEVIKPSMIAFTKDDD